MASASAPRPVYPPELEADWFDWARRALSEPDDAALCARLEPAVVRLAELFTTERKAGFDRYADDPVLMAAYGLFYFPQTYVRTALAFAECLAAGAPPAVAAPALHVADVGAGAGAAGLAVALALRAQCPDARISISACDRSPGSLARLPALARTATRGENGIEVATEASDGHLWKPARPANVIVASFALNELFQDRPDTDAVPWINRLVRSLAPDGLLLILEPAAAACATRLWRLRDTLAAAGGEARIVAPCPHSRPCPLLARGGDRWCHEVRKWRAPPAIERINRHLHRDIFSLKFSFLALQRRAATDAAADPGVGRLVAPLRYTGGRIVSHLCAEDGAATDCETLTRRLSKAEVRAIIREWERGDRVRLTDPSLIGNGRTLRGSSIARDFGFAP